MPTLAEQIRRIADTMSGLDLNVSNKLDSIAVEVDKLEAEKLQYRNPGLKDQNTGRVY